MTTTVGRMLVITAGLAKVKFLVRTIGFARTVSLMGMVPVAPWATRTVDPRWRAEIAAAGRAVRASCLDRSLVFWFFCREYDVVADLRIGVMRTGDGVDAHAWVEVDGAVANDDPEFVGAFAAFDEDPTNLVFT